jgi:16S rRNA processing protein RimM
MADQGERICLGVIGTAHGLDGAVTIRSYTADPADIASYGPLHDAAGRAFKLKVRRITPKGVIVKVEGVEDRTQAEALKGTELFIERSKLPQTDEDEFYYADLIGLTAEDRNGKRIGTVAWLDNYGAGDIIEITRDDGRNEMWPFSKQVVVMVDMVGRRLVMDLPTEQNDD